MVSLGLNKFKSRLEPNKLKPNKKHSESANLRRA